MNALLLEEAKLTARKDQELTAVIRAKCAEIAYAYLGTCQSFISTAGLSKITGYTPEQIHASAGTFKSLIASDTIQFLTEKLLRSVLTQAIEGNMSAARLYMQMVAGPKSGSYTPKSHSDESTSFNNLYNLKRAHADSQKTASAEKPVLNNDMDERTLFKELRNFWQAEAESKKKAAAEQAVSNTGNRSAIPQNTQVPNAVPAPVIPAQPVQVSKPDPAKPAAESAAVPVASTRTVIKPELPSRAADPGIAQINSISPALASGESGEIIQSVNTKTNQISSEQVAVPAKTVLQKSPANQPSAS
ncbi:MAG: hypothetical protein V4543_09570, partial [Bacteroidota bacterium]